MNDIFRHIEYLLLRHDCVIVPGFGAFIATVTPARIDHELGTIIPPGRRVMFNQSVTIDDGLLANSISRKENLSFEESRQVILKSVENIKATLISSGHISVGGLGEILIGEEETILFQPSSLWCQSAKSLGYHAAVMPSQKPIMAENATPRRRFANRFSRIAAAVAAIAVIAIAALLNPLSSGDSHEQRASVVPVEVLVKPKKVEAVAIEEKATSTAVIAAKEITPIVDTLKSEKPQDRFFLIVGTFTTAHEAERYAEKYSTDEYHLTTVPSRKVTRVAIASSNRKEDLLPMLNSKDIAGKFPNSWIWSE